MRILIDFGHPAHVHYFRNFIKIMRGMGHEFTLVARDKEVLHQLLSAYGFRFENRGQGGKGIIGKVLYIFKADWKLFRATRRFKPDLFLSFASTYAAHVSKLYGKPHIALDDTEHAKLELLMYPPFTDVIVNPSSFQKRFSSKQIFLNSFFELCYLHPNYFTADPTVPGIYDLDVTRPYFIVRFVSWTASHDIGARGINNALKADLVSALSEKGRVIISAEGPIPQEFEKYRLHLKPEHLHHLLVFASLYIGEGATTASECVALGTPAIYVNSLDAGTLQEQARDYGLISLRNDEELLAIVNRVLGDISGHKEKARRNREKLLNEKTDPTAFLVDFISKYPDSKKGINIQKHDQ